MGDFAIRCGCEDLMISVQPGWMVRPVTGPPGGPVTGAPFLS